MILRFLREFWIPITLALVASVAAGIAAYHVGRWLEAREHEDRPAEQIDEEKVEEPFREDPPGRLNLLEREAPVVREGRGPELEPDDPDRSSTTRYAAAVLESEPIDLPDDLRRAPGDTAVLLPRTAGAYNDGILSLGAVGSDNRWHRRDFECPEGRRMRWATRDTTMFASCERALPSLLGEVGKTALVCGGTAAAGYGIAVLAEYEHPERVAGVAGGGCVLIRIVD